MSRKAMKPVAWTDENFTELIVSEDIAKDIGATVPLYTSPPKREPPCKTGSQCTTKCTECAEPEPVIDKSAAIRIATSLGWTPKRKPLTKEQVWQAYMEISAVFDCNEIDLVEFARAIEAAHGIKGES